MLHGSRPFCPCQFSTKPFFHHPFSHPAKISPDHFPTELISQRHFHTSHIPTSHFLTKPNFQRAILPLPIFTPSRNPTTPFSPEAGPLTIIFFSSLLLRNSLRYSAHQFFMIFFLATNTFKTDKLFSKSLNKLNNIVSCHISGVGTTYGAPETTLTYPKSTPSFRLSTINIFELARKSCY